MFWALPVSIKRLKTEEQKTYPLIFSPPTPFPHPLLLVVETNYQMWQDIKHQLSQSEGKREQHLSRIAVLSKLESGENYYC